MYNSQQIFEMHLLKKYMKKSFIFVEHLEMWNLSKTNTWLALYILEKMNRDFLKCYVTN